MKGHEDNLLILKRVLYIGKKAIRRAPQIHCVTGVVQQDFVIRYLGVPIFAGRSKLIYFEHLVDKVRRKLDGWKAKIMSFAGKLNRIKYVLTSVSPYTHWRAHMSRSPSSNVSSSLWITFFGIHKVRSEFIGLTGTQSVDIKKKKDWVLEGFYISSTVYMGN